MWFKKFFTIFSIFMASTSLAIAQTTYSPVVRSKNNSGVIEKVQLTNNETIVTIKVPRSKQWGASVEFSSATVLVPTDAWDINDARRLNLDVPNYLPSSEYAQLYADLIRRIREGREVMSKAGFLIRSLGVKKLDTKYYITEKGRKSYYFFLHFDRLPHGCENVYIRELQDGGFEWIGIQINNPYPNVPNIGLNETQIKQRIDSQNDGIVGIYEGFSDNKYKLACIKDGDEYKLIYMGSHEPLNQWHFGDVKAILRTSATPGFFKVNWYMANKTINPDVYAMFEGGSMKIVIDEEEDGYLKMYPTSNFTNNPSALQEWSGTGYAIAPGYIVTNNHVVGEAKTITIKGVKGDMNIGYSAEVVATDKVNDIAIVKVNDVNFNGFGQVPYAVQQRMADVGEDVFVLGYPLTQALGNEIKLTNGIVSSRTGYQGDIATYQISAPVQPGNSGGPMFDSKGNVIGIVVAGVPGADNVGYAIKTSYLKILIESAGINIKFPANNTISTLSLAEKVKKLKNFVYYIECSK